MNHSLLLSILLIVITLMASVCIVMILFLCLNKYNGKDKWYKYSRRHLMILVAQGMSITIFITSIYAVISNKNNNLWLLILSVSLASYIAFWIVAIIYNFRMLVNYELNEYKEEKNWEEKENSLKGFNIRKKYEQNQFWYLIIALVIFAICAIILQSIFKISLYWLTLTGLVIAVASILLFFMRNVENNNVNIKNVKNITVTIAISISLALGLIAWGSISASAAMELPGAPNGLSKKIDNLEKSNHRIEAKLKKERKTNIQNKKYIKKVVKESHKTNINIKKITNNTTINRIMKSKPHDPHTPTKKSPSPKKPPYQDPKGKLPDTGEAKSFWQW